MCFDPRGTTPPGIGTPNHQPPAIVARLKPSGISCPPSSTGECRTHPSATSLAATPLITRESVRRRTFAAVDSFI